MTSKIYLLDYDLGFALLDENDRIADRNKFINLTCRRGKVLSYIEFERGCNTGEIDLIDDKLLILID